MTVGSKRCFYPHFVDDETQLRQARKLAPGTTAAELRARIQTQVSEAEAQALSSYVGLALGTSPILQGR